MLKWVEIEIMLGYDPPKFTLAQTLKFELGHDPPFDPHNLNNFNILLFTSDNHNLNFNSRK